MSGSDGRTVMNILLMCQFDKEISLHRIKDINLVLALYYFTCTPDMRMLVS